MENLDLYQKVRSVPDSAKKTIKGGRTSGMTDINPMWRINFNPQGSREPRQQNYPNLLHIPPNILCIMLFSPQFNQFSPFTQPAFTAFSSVFQVRISQAFHVSLAFAPGLKGSQLTETNSTYILHNPSFPAYILHAAKPLPPPPDTLSIQASFVPDIWHPA